MPSLNGIASLWILFMMYSFAGWCCESTACSYRQRKFVNRGFLNGPYLPIYGSGSLAAIVLLKDVQNPVLLFLLGGLLTCTIEYLTSYVMERIYHARWWDYSKRPLNLHGRVWIG
ncbi:MAG: putative ABC transporter permease, partial [Olsenella sp.]